MTVQQWLGKDNKIGIDIWERKYQKNGENFDQWLDRVSGQDVDVRKMIVEKKFLFGGRVLSNRRLPDAGNLFNCFSYGYIEDDYGKILDAVKDLGMTFKAQGGQGISLSKLRPQGTPIGKLYKSDGILPFMRLYNSVTAETSQGGCIFEDELVLTPNGNKKIKDIQIGDLVWTKVGFKKVVNKWDKGIQPIFQVVTQKGYTIKTTEDHKYCVDGFNVVPLKELKINSKINIISGNLENEFKFDELAYFLGCFYANGYISPNKCGTIVLHKQYKEVGDKLIKIIKELGFDSWYVNNKCSQAITLRLPSDLCCWLDSQGLLKQKTADIRVPSYIMYGNNSTVISFLSGCLDSDGCLKSGNKYTYTSISKTYCEQLALLFNQVGFYPSISCEKRKNSGRQDLYNISCSIFNNCPAFSSVKMNRKFVGAVKNSRYHTPYTKNDLCVTEKDAKHLRKLNDSTPIGLYTFYNIKNPKYKSMIFDSIASITSVGEGHVYDIEVEDEHKFYCNGFYVSNSRKGALMISLDIRHKEASNFIHIKNNITAIDKANLSFEIDDDFMRAVETYYKTGEIITLHEHREYSGHVVDYDIVPIDIYKEMCKNAYDWGDPACLFTNRFRNYNIMEKDDEYQIITSNPCGEQPLPAGGACCLASINLSAFITNPYEDSSCFDYQAFEEAVRIGVKGLDGIIDENAEKQPLPKQKEMSINYRNIGLGVFGYANALMKLQFKYGSPEAKTFTDLLFKNMFRTAVFESSKLASIYGSFPKYSEKVWESTIIKNNFSPEEIMSMKAQGLRNCSILSVAPAGTIATMVGCSGGCEPEFAIKYTRKTESASLNQSEYYDIYCTSAQEYKTKYPNTTDLPSYFVSSSEIPWRDRVETQGIMQKYVDTAISSTVNLPNDITIDEVENLFLYAWKQGLKGITIFRDNCKKIGVLTTPTNEEDKKPKEDTFSENKVKEKTLVSPSLDENGKIKNVLKPRSSVLNRGDIIDADDNVIGLKRKLITGCGSLHCTAYFDPDTGDLLETYFNKGSTGGCNSFMTGLSRTISLLARAGVDIYTIVDQLESSGTCPSYAVRSATQHDTSKGASCPSAIGRALIDMYKEMQTHVTDTNFTDGDCENDEIIKEKKNSLIKTVQPKEKKQTTYSICPECGEKMLVYEGGCITCKACGWSKCN